LAASRTKGIKAKTVDALVWFHRWLGVATCLVFALWFASGAVLLFKPFPSLDRSSQLALSAPIDSAAIAVPPGAAMARAKTVTGLRVVQRAGVPAYLVEGATGTMAVDARNGARLPDLRRDQIAALSGRPQTAIAGPFDYDQWIVHNSYDPLRPFYRIDLGDAAGTQLYVSARTGEPVQRTTRWDRGWNWVGAVLHWAYFTPLRSSFTAWDQSVWWLSFVAMWVAIAGTILGVIRTLAVRRAGRPGLTFYRLKWLRWHHLLGLFASLFVLTWILSGWLSMDHGRIFSRGHASETQAAAYAGQTLGQSAAQVELSALAHLPDARQIRLSTLDGESVLSATDGKGVTTLLRADGSLIDATARHRLIGQAIAAAWPGRATGRASKVAPTDIYALAEGMPLTVRRYDRDGDKPVAIYVDSTDGRIVTVMDNSRAAYAWIYYALHTFNFPGLTTHPLLRYIVVMIPLLLGFLFSLTGVVIGYRRIAKSL
jgi:uncharacterized iron-regulated membrane protein